MAEQFDIGVLQKQSMGERLVEYAAALPDGKAVTLAEAAEELGLTYSPALSSARKEGITFSAFLAGMGGGARAMIANPQTVKAWHDAQKKLPAKKR
jgi:hypothetical protein